MTWNKPTGAIPKEALLAFRACRLIRRLAVMSVSLCAVVQLLLEPSSHNAVSVLIITVTSVITFQLVIRAHVIRTAPLPALVVLGFNFATMSGALIAQTLGLRSLVFNLQVPELTFGSCGLFQASLVVTLLTFTSSRALRAVSDSINANLFKSMGLMRAPSPTQLWLFGILGSAVLAWASTVVYSGEVEYGDVGAKFLLGLTYLAYAPLLIPVLRFAFTTVDPPGNVNFWLLPPYLVVLLILAFATNSRGTFAMGVANLGLAAFLLLLLGQLELTGKLRRWLATGAIVLVVLMPTLSDIAIAMVVVRGERGTIASSELISRTWTAFQDKQALQDYRRAATVLTSGGDYEENYLENPFLARLVQTKFFDNTLSLNEVRSGQRAAALWDITLDKTLALLPTPVLRLIGAEVNKSNLEFSIGYALYSQEYGVGLGPYMTGSSVGHGLALMGPLVYVVVVPLFLLTFIALQSLTSFSSGFLIISPVVLIQAMRIYYLACGDSLLDPIALMLRTLPQDILIYWTIFHVTSWIDIFNGGKRERANRRSQSPSQARDRTGFPQP